MSIDAVTGTLIGSGIGAGITLLTVYLTHSLTEKREKRKVEMEREEAAISQVYSPLVFILEKTRGMFASIMALANTLKGLSEAESKNEISIFILNYVVAEKSATYPKVLENLLLHKSGFIRSSQFYLDLVVLESYLSTIVGFLNMLIFRSAEKPAQLRKCVSSMGPLVQSLDEAIGSLREYSIAKAIRKTVEYRSFFTQQKYAELEGYVDEISKTITGEGVIDWKTLLERMRKD